MPENDVVERAVELIEKGEPFPDDLLNELGEYLDTQEGADMEETQDRPRAVIIYHRGAFGRPGKRGGSSSKKLRPVTKSPAKVAASPLGPNKSDFVAWGILKKGKFHTLINPKSHFTSAPIAKGRADLLKKLLDRQENVTKKVDKKTGLEEYKLGRHTFSFSKVGKSGNVQFTYSKGNTRPADNWKEKTPAKKVPAKTGHVYSSKWSKSEDGDESVQGFAKFDGEKHGFEGYLYRSGRGWTVSASFDDGSVSEDSRAYRTSSDAKKKGLAEVIKKLVDYSREARMSEEETEGRRRARRAGGGAARRAPRFRR